MIFSKNNNILEQLYFLKACGYKFIGSNFTNFAKNSDFSSVVELNNQIKNCNLCALRKSANNVLVGSGDISSGLMLLSLAPSIGEDQSGKHLEGIIGERLCELIFKAVGLEKEQIYSSSILRCKGNENERSIELCKPYLLEEITLVSPRVIIALGEEVFLNLYPQSLQSRSFDSVRGAVFKFGSSLVLPTFSGEKIIKNPSLEEIFLKDLSTIRGLI